MLKFVMLPLTEMELNPRDSSGRVTHYIYREMGATDRLVKKIK